MIHRERRRPRSPRIAIVSDPLVQRGGAERVVEAMAAAFPEAPIFAVVYSARTGPASLAARVTSSWLQRIPGAAARHRLLFPMFASAVESFDLSGYDVIVSSHHTAAKGVLRGADQVHVCYCHTPMRALWERSQAELATLPGAVRPIAASLLSSMRVWDYAAAGRVDLFVANSRVTQERILRHYGRSSSLLAPPIDIERFTLADHPSQGAEPYYLVASRPVPYKRVDIAVAAALAANRRVVVAGGAHKGLPADARVRQVGVVGDLELIALMRGANALLFPQHEDFGMTPLEMNACGRPTIAFGSGGALDTIVDGKTGILVDEQSVEAFSRGIARLEATAFDPTALRAHAITFARDAFVEKLRELVADAWRSRLFQR